MRFASTCFGQLSVICGLACSSPCLSLAAPANPPAESLAQWHFRDLNVTGPLTALTFGDNEFVAIEESGPSSVLSSRDGVEWKRQLTSVDLSAVSLARAQQRYLLVNQNGFLNTSSNGVDWVIAQNAAGVASSVHFIDQSAYVVGSAQFIFCFAEPCPSAVPVIWSVPEQGEWGGTMLGGEGTVRRSAFATGHGIQVVVTRVDPGIDGLPLIGNPRGLVISQSSGAGYTEVLRVNEPFRPFPLPVGVAYGNGMFVAVVSLSDILFSTDGRRWNSVAAPEGSTLQDVAFGDGQFVAVGGNGAIVTSRNGVAWESRSSGTTAGLTKVAFGNHTFVIIGSPNVVLQSDPIVTLKLQRTPAIELTVTGPAGSHYQIETASDPLATEWKVLEDVVSPGESFSFLPPITASEHYYRAVRLP